MPVTESLNAILLKSLVSFIFAGEQGADVYFSLSQPVIFSERSIKMIFADPLRSI